VLPKLGRIDRERTLLLQMLLWLLQLLLLLLSLLLPLLH
jgi:hypothetical protein